MTGHPHPNPVHLMRVYRRYALTHGLRFCRSLIHYEGMRDTYLQAKALVIAMRADPNAAEQLKEFISSAVPMTRRTPGQERKPSHRRRQSNTTPGADGTQGS